MGTGHYSLSWASRAYLYCILTLLFGDGLAAVYNDRRGQPEMQQAMDNAPLPLTRNLPFPSGQDNGYPILLTQKTSTLLSEALDMLRRIKDVRQRKWVEAFIHRLGNLAADLEESNSRKITKVQQETIVQPFDVKMPSMSSSPTSPAASSKFGKGQTKYQVTSAQINDVLPVNEGHMNRQVVTKPSLLTTNADDDLVLQLHNQDSKMKPKYTPLDAHVTYHTRVLDSTVTPPITPLSINKLKKVTQTEEKTKTRQTLLSKLLNEIDVLKHQKEPGKDMKSLFNSQHVADFTNPNLALDQKHSFLADDDDEFEIEEDEGAAAGELDEDEEPPKNTVSPSWQQVMEAAKAEARHPVAERQQYRPIKQFAPPEPTMSDEMERQLRAGKIIVLSDSLVRTNFQSKDNDGQEYSVTQPISPSRSPVANAVERRVSNKLPQNHSNEGK